MRSTRHQRLRRLIYQGAARSITMRPRKIVSEPLNLFPLCYLVTDIGLFDLSLFFLCQQAQKHLTRQFRLLVVLHYPAYPRSASILTSRLCPIRNSSSRVLHLFAALQELEGLFETYSDRHNVGQDSDDCHHCLAPELAARTFGVFHGL